MPTNVLTTGTAVANSSDVVVAADAFLTVALKDAAGPAVPGDAQVQILLKDDAGAYFYIDQLTQQRPSLVISAGTWRFTRVGGTCGVFSG